MKSAFRVSFASMRRDSSQSFVTGTALAADPGITDTEIVIGDVEPLTGPPALLGVAASIGHKLAIKALPKDATVIKYGVDIGRVVAPIAVGEHAHVQNIKTKRW